MVWPSFAEGRLFVAHGFWHHYGLEGGGVGERGEGGSHLPTC